jgi:hypothetical protein
VKVSWDDDIPNIWKNKNMFQTTNQKGFAMHPSFAYQRLAEQQTHFADIHPARKTCPELVPNLDFLKTDSVLHCYHV